MEMQSLNKMCSWDNSREAPKKCGRRKININEGANRLNELIDYDFCSNIKAPLCKGNVFTEEKGIKCEYDEDLDVCKTKTAEVAPVVERVVAAPVVLRGNPSAQPQPPAVARILPTNKLFEAEMFYFDFECFPNSCQLVNIITRELHIVIDK